MTRSSVGILCLVLMQTACLANNGISIEMTRLVSPTNTCTFEVSNTSLPSLTYDPAFALRAKRALMVPIATINNLSTNTSDPIRNPAGQNVRPKTHDVTISGARVCFYRQLAPPSPADGAQIQCSDLPPGQTDVVPVSGYIPVSGSSVVLIDGVLTLPGLQALYGADFKPDEIPIIGRTDLGFLTHLSSAQGSARHPAWGNFPESGVDVVVIQVRLVGQTQGDVSIESSWFSFPVRIEPGLVNTACTAASYRACSADNACTGTNDFCIDPCNSASSSDLCSMDTGNCIVSGLACTPSRCSVSTQVTCLPFREDHDALTIETTCRPDSGLGTTKCTVAREACK